MLYNNNDGEWNEPVRLRGSDANMYQLPTMNPRSDPSRCVLCCVRVSPNLGALRPHIHTPETLLFYLLRISANLLVLVLTAQSPSPPHDINDFKENCNRLYCQPVCRLRRYDRHHNCSVSWEFWFSALHYAYIRVTRIASAYFIDNLDAYNYQ